MKDWFIFKNTNTVFPLIVPLGYYYFDQLFGGHLGKMGKIHRLVFGKNEGTIGGGIEEIRY